MAEGTNVGSIYLDLVVRNTVDKQVKTMAAQAQATAQKAFSGTEKAVETMANKTAAAAAQMTQKMSDSLMQGTNKQVALARAQVKKLEQDYERINNRFKDVSWSYGYNENADKATDKLTERLAAQREAAYDRLASAREKLAIYEQISAEKEAAAESAASQKAVAAEEKSANRRKSIHASMWKNMLVNAGSAANAITGKITSIIWHFTKADKSASRFGTRLKGIVSSALIFNILSAGLRNVTSYLGETISSTDEMKSALSNLKGAAANAASPIIQVLTPALATLANTAATVFSYVSKLLTMLTGKVSNAAAMATKSSANAASAAKKATKSVASFDEINTLSSSSEDSGGGGASESEGFNYDFQGQSPFLDSVLAAINAGQWDQVGALFAQKVNDSLSKIDWKSAGTSLSNCAKGLLTTLTSFLEKTDWQQIGSGIKEFLSAIDWSGISTALFESIGAALGGLAAFFQGLIEDAWTSAVDWWYDVAYEDGEFTIEGLLQGIWNGICNIYNWIIDNIFKPFIDGFKKAFGIHSPSTVMEEQGGFVVEGLLNGITATWKSIKDFFKDALAKLKETLSKAWASIKDKASSAWGSVKDKTINVVNGIKTKVSDVFNAVKTKTADIFGKIKEKISDIWNKIRDKISNAVKSIKTKVTDGFNAVKTKVSDIFGKVKDKVYGVWNGIKDKTSNTVKSVKTKVTYGFNSVKSKVSDIFGKVKDTVYSKWNSIRDKISDVVTGIKTKISDKFTAVKDSVKKVFTSVKDTVSDIWDKIASTIKGVINGIIGSINGMISGIASGINTIIRALNKLKFDIPDWVPAFGGKTFGFNISEVSAPKIPMLAGGAVIRQPTLAMMGEYTGASNNPEIVAPQSIIAETVADVMKSASEGKDAAMEKIIAVLMDIDRLLQLIAQSGDPKIVFTGELAALARLLKPYIDKENRRVGVSLVKGGT